MNIENILGKIGFSENESKIYLACLELGEDSAQNIGAHAGIKRTTAYSVLTYLLRRGLVVKIERKKKARFIAESPDRLLAIIIDIQTEIKKAIPELQGMSKSRKTKPKVVLYEGREAIALVYEDTLKENPDEILEWNSSSYFLASKINATYINKRVKYNIRARRIVPADTLWATKHKKRDHEELAETRIVPKILFDPEVEINIYKNKVAFINFSEKLSLIIESPAIAKTMRQIYEISWNEANA